MSYQSWLLINCLLLVTAQDLWVFDLDDQFNYTLDLSSMQLGQLKMDISQLASKGRGNKMIVLKMEEGESNQTSYFKWKMESKKFREMKFQAVDSTFVKKLGRLTSPGCNIITVKCHKIQEIILCARLETSETWIADVTLNLVR